MIYYKTRPEADGKGIYNHKGEPGYYLIEGELFTERELGKWCERGYRIPSRYFERVEISKRDVFTSFGVRLQVKTPA